MTYYEQPLSGIGTVVVSGVIAGYKAVKGGYEREIAREESIKSGIHADIVNERLEKIGIEADEKAQKELTKNRMQNTELQKEIIFTTAAIGAVIITGIFLFK